MYRQGWHHTDGGTFKRGKCQMGDSQVPVPAAYVLCEDVGVIGTPFYVMDFVDGCVFTDPSLPDLAPRCRQQVQF
jgi:aminoglycoside phosphotransferase (APT) family kinase protein